MGWLIKKGLYGAHQSGSTWAKTFRIWMHKNYPQYVEAGNERCVYVIRESEELALINLDELRGLKIEKNRKIIIMIMNTDDMLIAYSDNARDTAASKLTPKQERRRIRQDAKGSQFAGKRGGDRATSNAR